MKSAIETVRQNSKNIYKLRFACLFYLSNNANDKFLNNRRYSYENEWFFKYSNMLRINNQTEMNFNIKIFKQRIFNWNYED